MAKATRITSSDWPYMRQAGLVVARVHAALRDACQPGITTKELDQVAYECTVANEALPNFLGYQGFSGSVCISVNDEIVHGIPGSRTIEDGDIVSFDCGAKVKGRGRQWHADAAFTMIVGQPRAPRAASLNSVTEGAMWAGIAALATAKKVNDVGGAVEDYVEAQAVDLGWMPGIIEGYAGHAIGNHLHEDPLVYNYRTRRSPRLGSGMAVCVEPMLVAGEIDTRVLRDDWTVVTVDGSVAAHWEHTVGISEAGISVLTAPDYGRSGLAPFGVLPVSLGN